MKGTDIYYISGHRSPRIGLGQFYPGDLSADSVPNPDEWGPDNYWTPQAYIDWFTLNIAVYGIEAAKNKMYQAIDTWTFGGVEFDYCYDQRFTEFFAGYGIDVATGFCRIVNEGGEVLDDVTETVSSVTSIGKIAIPFFLIGGLVWIATASEPREYVKRKFK